MVASKWFALVTIVIEFILGIAEAGQWAAIVIGITGGFLVRYAAGRESNDPQGAFPLVAAGSALMYCAGLFVIG